MKPRRFLQMIWLFVFTALPCLASDAAFSKDGQRVCLIQPETSKLIVIDIEKQSTSELDLGTFTGKQPIARSVGRDRLARVQTLRHKSGAIKSWLS
jgi:hypothetical protein